MENESKFWGTDLLIGKVMGFCFCFNFFICFIIKQFQKDVAGNLDEFEEKETRGNIRQCHEMAFRGTWISLPWKHKTAQSLVFDRMNINLAENSLYFSHFGTIPSLQQESYHQDNKWKTLKRKKGGKLMYLKSRSLASKKQRL